MRRSPALHFWGQRLFRKNAVSPLFLRLICLAAGLAASLATADLAIPSGPVRLLAVLPLTLVGGGLFWLVPGGGAAVAASRRAAAAPRVPWAALRCWSWAVRWPDAAA